MQSSIYNVLSRENTESQRLGYLPPGCNEGFYRSLTSEQIPKVRVGFSGRRGKGRPGRETLLVKARGCRTLMGQPFGKWPVTSYDKSRGYKGRRERS